MLSEIDRYMVSPQDIQSGRWVTQNRFHLSSFIDELAEKASTFKGFEVGVAQMKNSSKSRLLD